jgi:hypothetical protein
VRRGGRFGRGWAGYPGRWFSSGTNHTYGLGSEEAQVSAKLGFAAGLAVGLLAGSRAGRGLYDRSASAASAVVHDPRVRSGATSALHKAGSAGSSVAGSAARRVKGRGKASTDAQGETSDGVEGAEGMEGAEGDERERDGAALRGRTKRLIGGARKRAHGMRVNGHGAGAGAAAGFGMKGSGAGVKGAGVKAKGAGVKIARPHLHRAGHGEREQAQNGARHAGEPQNGAWHEGMSAPYVQPKPKSGDEGE